MGEKSNQGDALNRQHACIAYAIGQENLVKPLNPKKRRRRQVNDFSNFSQAVLEVHNFLNY